MEPYPAKMRLLMNFLFLSSVGPKQIRAWVRPESGKGADDPPKTPSE